MINVVLKILFPLLFRTKVLGLHHIDFSKKAILMPNHVSLLDAIILSLYLPKNVIFVAHTSVAKRYSFIFRLRKCITIDQLNPYSIRHMVRLVNNGAPLMLFPEGRITRTGGLMKIYNGIGYLALKTGANIYPMIINGLERSKFSYMQEKNRTCWFPKVRISIGEPCTFELDSQQSMKVQKEKVSDAILTLLQEELCRSRTEYDVNLFNKLLEASSTYDSNQPICEDLTQQADYKQLLRSTYTLSQKLKKTLEKEETVGLLLPNTIEHVVAFFSLCHLGKTPALLNFSKGTQYLVECCETVQIQTILTSKHFIKQGKLEHLIDALKGKISFVFIEEIEESSGIRNPLNGWIHALRKTKSQATRNELILFTTNEENKVKGVVLTHSNVYNNIQQVRSVIDFTSKDKVFNALPMFHSYGLTAGTLLPILCGIPVFLYLNPQHYKVIPEFIYDQNPTLLFGTSSFLEAYGKFAHPYDFYSLRYVFAGMESLELDVRELWLNKFGIRIFEGYGTTETSPILTLNTPLLYKKGSVGRFLPGIQYKIEAAHSEFQGGKLLVKGVNVMKGYYLHHKGFTLVEDWFDTGEIVVVDEQKFIFIQSRKKRSTPIGNDMPSLNLIEEVVENENII
ncbi:AMP-binding protein [Caldalkalibacillus mannanilyticus]|uniref:AMP-binding protein n=1 Tax=Caldalkalibacillus mannanilyticus TaxID=1418 RepID=UPI001F294144|nr:AMP-binding protein [Caldalkalibacillus mannanilyticus]